MTTNKEILPSRRANPADGQVYQLDGDSYTAETVQTQPGDAEQEWEKRIENWGLGWGSQRYEQPGTYDYASPGNMHRRGVFLQEPESQHYHLVPLPPATSASENTGTESPPIDD